MSDSFTFYMPFSSVIYHWNVLAGPSLWNNGSDCGSICFSLKILMQCLFSLDVDKEISDSPFIQLEIPFDANCSSIIFLSTHLPLPGIKRVHCLWNIIILFYMFWKIITADLLALKNVDPVWKDVICFPLSEHGFALPMEPWEFPLL